MMNRHNTDPPSLQRDVKEIKDRTRRIETRVTRFLESQGFDTEVKKPLWVDDQIVVPTRACSINDCLMVVPSDWPSDKAINIYVHDDYLMTVYMSPED